jgi:hypothetical protein
VGLGLMLFQCRPLVWTADADQPQARKALYDRLKSDWATTDGGRGTTNDDLRSFKAIETR